MSTEVVLRSLKLDDVEVIASFEREIAKISFPESPILDIKFYSKKISGLIGDPNVETFVAEHDQKVVGWAYVSKRKNFITKEEYADFHSVYVDPGQRGSGLVSKLANAVLEHCQRNNLTQIVFRTRATNEPMKSVLARHGYVPTQIYYTRNVKETSDKTEGN
jgi:L-amino acid N-acyltransferase YncA